MADIAIDGSTSALAIAEAVRSGRATALDVVTRALGRIETIDAALGAFTVVFHDAAPAAAAAVDRRVAAGEALPLAGVPVAVKDHIWVAGAVAANGSRVLEDFVPGEDCAAVARLRHAGAVVVGKTNNPEFCYRGDTDSPLFGLTRNPYDFDRTPGGSSGGSAVAVAAGMTPLSLGTDGGGSIRCPSDFCGVTGHKPTHGLVPTRPGFRGWPTLSVHGPMGRRVADVGLMLSVMAGVDPADPLSAPAGPALHPRQSVEPFERTVAVSADFGFAVLEPTVRSLFERAVGTLADAGWRLVEANPPVSDDPLELWGAIADPESYASEGEYLDDPRITDFSRSALRSGERATARQYLDAQHRREQLSRLWNGFFSEYDALIYPGEQLRPFRHEDSNAVHDIGHWWAMDAIANLTRQPVTSLPCGVGHDGLPHGIQIMSARHCDRQVLDVAAAMEGAFPPVEPTGMTRQL